MNKIMAMLAAFCVAGAAFAIETVTSNGVTYARHGSIDQRNQMVVTDVNVMPQIASATNDLWQKVDNNVVKKYNCNQDIREVKTMEFYDDFILINYNDVFNGEEYNTCIFPNHIELWNRGDPAFGNNMIDIWPDMIFLDNAEIYYPTNSGRLVVDSDLSSAVESVDVPGQLAPLSNELQTVKGEVITIANTINGASGRLEVTNYDSQVSAPSLKIQYSLDQNVWKTAWDENTRLRPLEEGLLDISYYMTNFPFGLCSSLNGTPSPTGLLQVSHPIIQLGDRLEWHKSVTVNNSIYILSSTSPTFVFSNANTNQDFCVRDQFGDEVFKIERGEDKVVGASCNTFNQTGPNSWYIGCNISNDVQMASALTIWASTSLEKGKDDWREMGNGIANITRHEPIDHGEYKEYGFTINVYAVSSTMFFAANYKSTGKNQVAVGIPFNFQKINIGNKTYRVAPKTINGELVLGLTEISQ